MLDAVSPFVRWIDVFCETGAFDATASRRVLAAGQRAGLGLRVHAGQLGVGPGVALAVELGAASVDHCTHLSPRRHPRSRRRQRPWPPCYRPAISRPVSHRLPDGRWPTPGRGSRGHQLQPRHVVHHVDGPGGGAGGHPVRSHRAGGRACRDRRGSDGVAPHRHRLAGTVAPGRTFRCWMHPALTIWRTGWAGSVSRRYSSLVVGCGPAHPFRRCEAVGWRPRVPAPARWRARSDRAGVVIAGQVAVILTGHPDTG